MNVRVVLLCAGYGTRLSKNLEEDKSGQYDDLKGIPKPLLPIGHKPLISYWIEMFDNISMISDVYIISNELHKNHYESFLKNMKGIDKPIHLVSDGSLSNEERSGAVACMQLGIQSIMDDVLFIAGDTLLDQKFSLQEMIATFIKLKLKKDKVCLLVSAPVKEEDVSKHGIIEVNQEGQVTSFLEKPAAHETSSRWQSPCFYIMSKGSLPFIHEFLEARKDEPISQRDATGHIVRYLLSKVDIFAFPVHHRFDIGNLKSYVECSQSYT